MKLQTKDLSGAALDWAVAKCEGAEFVHDSVRALIAVIDGKWCGGFATRTARGISLPTYYYSPSTKWQQGGPIIARELLEISPHFESSAESNGWKGAWRWVAYVLGANNLDENCESFGPTPLIAAIRCYVASKLGDEIEVPDELTKE